MVFSVVHLAPAGITLPQYNVLRILRGAGSEGLPTLDVGERLIEHSPGITRMMDRLEERGWVTRARCPDDRRRVFCHLTPEGRSLVDRLESPVDQADETAVRGLGRGERRQLIRLLTKLRAAHE